MQAMYASNYPLYATMYETQEMLAHGGAVTVMMQQTANPTMQCSSIDATSITTTGNLQRLQTARF
jgi:hypothetical protein